MSVIEKLLNAMAQLRSPKKGCPWDQQQTHESILPYLVEETHEFMEALKEWGPQDRRTQEELGDLLFQVVFHARLMEEKGHTSFLKICEALTHKLVERHPHVFDETHPGFSTADEVNKAWEQIKAGSRKKTDSKINETRLLPKTKSLHSIPKALPALLKAARLGEKAASFGFDWATANDIKAKVREELEEWLEAGQGMAPEKLVSEAHEQEEFGDLVFAMAQYARKRGWSLEEIAGRSNHKFLKRFEKMEDLLSQRGVDDWKSKNLDELETYWQQAKRGD